MSRTADPYANFTCRRCGNCCRAPGYVHLRPGEAETIAAHLQLSLDQFHAQYTRLTDDRRSISLTEAADGACIFLQTDNLCRIAAVKPQQCRDYPYKWRSDLLLSNCAGILNAHS